MSTIVTAVRNKHVHSSARLHEVAGNHNAGIIMGVVDQLCLLLFLRVSVTHTHAHTHPFNGLFSGTTRVRNGTTRRHRFGAANSATRQFGTGPTRRGRFGAGTFRRIVSNGDIEIMNEVH